MQEGDVLNLKVKVERKHLREDPDWADSDDEDDEPDEAIFEKVFGAAHTTTFGGVAASFGLAYASAETPKELAAALAAAGRSDHPVLIEVQCTVCLLLHENNDAGA